MKNKKWGFMNGSGVHRTKAMYDSIIYKH